LLTSRISVCVEWLFFAFGPLLFAEAAAIASGEPKGGVIYSRGDSPPLGSARRGHGEDPGGRAEAGHASDNKSITGSSSITHPIATR